MYLNFKLPGSVLFCVSLGPAWIVPCSVAFQKFWYPAISLDSPFSPRCKNHLPYAQRSNNWKNISNSSKNWLCAPLGEPPLSHKSSLGSLYFLPGSQLSSSNKEKSSCCLDKWLFLIRVARTLRCFFTFAYFSYSNKSSLDQIISPSYKESPFTTHM